MDPTSPPGALVFDVFGTCVDWRRGVAREVAAIATAHGVALDAFAFADAWRAMYQPAMEEVRAGRRPWTILDVLHRESLDTLVPRFGLQELDDAARGALNRAWHRLDPWPDVVPGLLRLKRRFIIAPLSNGNVALLTNMAKRAGLPWDLILGAETSGAYKPQPRAYLRAAEMLGLAPSDVMLVAAHNGDLAAARAVGLRTAFVARPAEFGAGSPQAERVATAAWTRIAEDFVDLAVQLDA
jgi:2-haloacid dehalogenase